MQLKRLTKTVRSMKRYQRILRVLFKYGFEDILDRFKIETFIRSGRKGLSKQKKAEIVQMSRQERIRLVLEELGPTFVKLGQMLSTRPDIVPAEFIEEFRKLQDEVVPFSGIHAREIIEKELGKSVDTLFLSFEEVPLAAASIAQVHSASTKSGDKVVIKVQRPGIRSTIRSDMEILSDLAHLIARRLPETSPHDPVGIVDEFNQWITKELDFLQEARNIDRFGHNFKDDETVYVPKVYWHLTTSRVLTMEYIDGIRISNQVRLEQAGLDRKTIATNGAKAVLKQIFEHGFFHGDPHPGNLFILKGNVIAPLDFGLMGRLDDELIDEIGNLLNGIVQKNVDKIVRVFLRIGIVREEGDVRTLKHDIGEFLDRYYQTPLYRVNFEQIINEVVDVVSRYRIRIPRDLYLMGKALVIMEGVGRTLDPDFDMISLAKPYVQKIMVRKLDPHRLMRDLSQLLEDFKDFIDTLPDNLRTILLKFRRGELGINIHHRGLDHLIRELDKSTNRLSFSLIIAALIIASSLIMQLNRGPQLFGLSAFGLIGYLIAAILGFWLIIAILRSGRL